MNKASRRKGFTLIEILLVVVIIGIMLAVIVPRAWRANVDAKYGLVRQAGSELVSFAMEWAEQNIVAQPENVSARVRDYMTTLCGTQNRHWVGATGVAGSNWNNNVPNRFQVVGSPVAHTPESCVEDIVAPEKVPRNPFNGASVFSPSNYPVSTGSPIPGALAGATVAFGNNNRMWALLFQGTDSTSTVITSPSCWHAGQGQTIEGLRNGIFMYHH